jgi:hypothetical protein
MGVALASIVDQYKKVSCYENSPDIAVYHNECDAMQERYWKEHPGNYVPYGKPFWYQRVQNKLLHREEPS